MERGVTVISLTERDDCVLAELEEADGTVKSVEAAWVMGQVATQLDAGVDV